MAMKTVSPTISNLIILWVGAAATNSCAAFQVTLLKNIPPSHQYKRTTHNSDLFNYQNERLNNFHSINRHSHGVVLKSTSNNGMYGDHKDAVGADQSQNFKKFSKFFCRFAPVWTLFAAVIGIHKSSTLATTIGSLSIMQKALSTLMLAMGLTVTPNDFGKAVQKPYIVILNALLCFVMMPLVALGIASIFQYNPSQTAGIVLLGSVSGGQASNLFALLAGGDVALSVVCTLSTTLLGVLATPLLIKWLLKYVIVVDGVSVLQSVASLVLLPLLCGLGAGRFAPRFALRISPFCPMLGVLSTLILVTGGAANSAFSLGMDKVSIIGSCMLPILGGGLALLLSYLSVPPLQETMKMNESSRRTLVVETLSKSPTLAYVLAQKHFGPSAASVPAAGMVSMAVIGALVATAWSMVAPLDRN